MKENQFTINGLTVNIERDEDPQSPQEGDNGLFLVATHKQLYVCSPDHPPRARSLDIAQEIKSRKKTHWIFPLEAYIHGGVFLALSGEGNFPDRQWDVSQIGVVFAAKNEWRLSKKARKAAESLIAIWNQYLGGDVWYYTVKDATGKTLDSCGGCYGLEYAREEATAMAKAYSVTKSIPDCEVCAGSGRSEEDVEAPPCSHCHGTTIEPLMTEKKI